MKKLTIEFIKEQFEKEGYTLLSTKYISNKLPLNIVCSKGHVGTITWNSWKDQHRCFECSGSKKLTIEFIYTQFEKEGYTLLSNKYINSAKKLEYICPNGHINSIAWANWQQGQRCADCAGLKKLTIEFIREEFKKEGYTLLTKEYVNNKQRLEYICPRGHFGNTIWNSWVMRRRCKQCRYENNKGSNNPSWNPLLTNEDRKKAGRRSSQCRTWAEQIKERDNYTCQVCGQHGGKICSHHIEAYNSAPELRTELSNGVTLCKKCHDNFHREHGRGNNTREQFEEFVNNY